jgi:hypothetical protein
MLCIGYALDQFAAALADAGIWIRRPTPSGRGSFA